MPRCGCSGSSCSCLVVGGSGVEIQGVGSAQQPYVISASPTFELQTDPLMSYTLDANFGQSSRSVYRIVAIEPSIIINLPDGASYPFPPAGSQIDVLLAAPASSVTWLGPHNWIEGEPATVSGWYTFILFGDFWMGKQVPGP